MYYDVRSGSEPFKFFLVIRLLLSSQASGFESLNLEKFKLASCGNATGSGSGSSSRPVGPLLQLY